MKFWETKNRLRRYLSFSNRTILVLECMNEEKNGNGNLSKIIEQLIVESPRYKEWLEKLQDDYPDIKER